MAPPPSIPPRRHIVSPHPLPPHVPTLVPSPIISTTALGPGIASPSQLYPTPVSVLCSIEALPGLSFPLPLPYEPRHHGVPPIVQRPLIRHSAGQVSDASFGYGSASTLDLELPLP
jgi:hypothetical protein